MNLHYCDKCKEDFDRMDKGYNPHNENCGHWECNLYDILNAICAIILIIPLLIIIIPFMLILNIITKLLKV